MAIDFPKIQKTVAIDRATAFPLDANAYFESKVAADSAVYGAEEVGSANTVYYFGQQIIVYIPSTGVADVYKIVKVADTTTKGYHGELQESDSIILGYKHPNYDVFFREQSYVNPIPRSDTKLYRDIPTGMLYYINETYTKLAIKLYDSYGQNTDGAMTQKAVTDSISAIKFKVLADDTENYLELDKPW